MVRSFIALDLPEDVADAIDDVQEGLAGAQWVLSENLHLTLVFLGDLDRRDLEDLDAALLGVDAAGFELALRGVDCFGGREARLVFAGVETSPALKALQRKVETAARAAGVVIDDRRYTPHVTLGRWGRGGVAPDALRRYVEANGLFRAGPFAVEAFHLYRSELGKHGAVYDRMASYPLRG